MSQQSNNEIDLRRFVRSVKQLKWVYLASFIFFMGLAITYCCIKQPQYIVRSTMLIEDNSEDGAGALAAAASGGMMSMMKSFNIGGFGGSSVDNEILLVNAHDVLINSAKDTKLNRTYFRREGLGKTFLNDDETPVIVEGDEQMFDTLRKAMKMRIKLHDGKADITVKKGLLGTVIGEEKNVSLPATVSTLYGDLMVIPTGVKSTRKNETIEVVVTGYENQADYLETEVDVDLADKVGDGIAFELLYPSRERGMAILNALMANYNEKRLDRKHENARTELDFVNLRLASVLDTLRGVEQAMKVFKETNNFVDIEAEAEVLVETALTTQGEVVKAKAEATYYKRVLETLRKNPDAMEVLPVFDSEAYPMIKDYNDLVLTTKELERSAKDNNPTLILAKESLAEMRKSVIKNVENLLDSANEMLAAQASLVSQAEARISSLPSIEQKYIALERDRRLFNSLYLYLLDKRENAMLQLASNNSLGFVVDSAYTALKPSKKKAIIVLVIAFLLALLCPSVLALIRTSRNKRLYSPIDLAPLGLEENTVEKVNTPDGISQLRALVEQHSEARHIFVADMSGATNNVAEDLSEKFKALGDKVLLINNLRDNDEIASVGTREILAEKSDRYIIINVPDGLKLPLLLTQLQSPEALLVAVAHTGESTSTTISSALATKPTAVIVAMV